MKKILCAFAVAALCLVACKQQSEPVDNHTKSGLDPADFVADVDGVQTGLYTLTNSHGMEVCITNFGGRIVSIVIRTGTASCATSSSASTTSRIT